ncbi:hypothetical protein [Pseudoalteromonas sp. MTN2-4]|uniref:hypothetical protein n=1 Tax=Pseudoalteromonas sp. MTN2-4 TaxID=3056555 RepID=UPI0036F3A4AA
MTLDNLAEQYVKLALAMGEHHPYYVDAYYGPSEWRTGEKRPLKDLKEDISTLLEQLEQVQNSETQSQRKAFLQVQTKSMLTFIQIINNEQVNFDDESLRLYDAVSPNITEAELDKALNELDLMLPGQGSVSERMNNFIEQFVIPKDKLDSVFKAAVVESRKRTKQYIELEEQESFTIEYVQDKVWSGYNWYQGNSFSLIQVNTDFPIYIARAIDLASHEGYPGHHVFNSLMEKHLVNGKGWIEYSVYPLFSPMSLLAEGSANFGVDVVFPHSERIKFERDVLFPLAGLDASKVELYYQVQAVKQQLSYADNMVAKRYLDGEIDDQKAIELLIKYTLVTEKKAQQRLGFIKANRAYVINYNLGQDIVKDYIENQTKKGTQAEIWALFSELLANPKTASMMQ